MERKRFILFGWLLLFSPAMMANTIKINLLNVLYKDKHYQLIFHISSPPRYRYFTLSHPDRLVLDIEDASLNHFFKRDSLKRTPVKKIRTAIKKNKTLRIVFDLRNTVKVDVRTLKSKEGKVDRLSVELSQIPLSRPQYINAYSREAPKKFFNINPSTIVSPSLQETADRSPNIIVVIDPGHGGYDPGAIGARGVREKDIVFKISNYLKTYINEQPGFKAYLTRHGDYYLTLRQRLAIARRHRADMFIAIHSDAYENDDVRGVSVFALSLRGATSEAARWLANKENESELIGGLDLENKDNVLKSVLINLSQTATIHASLKIGEGILRALNPISHLHHKRVDQAAFVVLKSPDIPSLLVETGFISNRYEEYRLLSHSYQKQIAVALKKGICNYFIHNPPRGTWLSKQKYSK